MASKYVDRTSLVQVIGCLYNSPDLLDQTDRYVITEDDFSDECSKIIVGTIYNLHESGVTAITLESINDYLANKPRNRAIYEHEQGEAWLLKASEAARIETFNYYYQRMKKMSLLRAYDSFGVDVKDIYDPDNVFDMKLKQEQEIRLDNMTLEDIAQKVDDKIDGIKARYVREMYDDAYQAGDGIDELIDKYKKSPEVGVPLYGSLVNTVTRGARLRKLYLRSAATGVGKSRTMIADACYIGCPKIYTNDLGWIRTSAANPTLYITTEQEKEEVQTMMLAFLSNVNEDHILNGYYIEDEEERVREAAKILAASPVYIEELPDFSLDDVEEVIKKNIREHDVRYVFYDYLHSSLKILEEVSSRTKGMALREDNILFMLSARLKDLCNTYGIFILTATQLNGSFKEATEPDQTLLRGSKAIADRIDYGSILMLATEEDKKTLEPIVNSGIFEQPNMKLSIYKNRRGRYKGIYLWCKGDLGTCRVNPMFATTYDYNLISIDDIKIIVKNNPEDSAF